MGDFFYPLKKNKKKKKNGHILEVCSGFSVDYIWILLISWCKCISILLLHKLFNCVIISLRGKRNFSSLILCISWHVLIVTGLGQLYDVVLFRLQLIRKVPGHHHQWSWLKRSWLKFSLASNNKCWPVNLVNWLCRQPFVEKPVKTSIFASLVNGAVDYETFFIISRQGFES